MRHLVTLLIALALVRGLGAHEHEDHAVVPETEHAADAAQAFDGPRESKGIAKIEPLASLDLTQDFPELKGRRLRARVIHLDPGAVVAVHEHQQRPGIAYVLEGEVVERRNDTDQPIVHGVGSFAIEHTGVVHWWTNATGTPARALVVDIVPE
ncbi:MAG TPA: cupin domain-containing protein [Planctomycetota bacterium]|nr:cupin domain-containing protein [Planctomycetota bacterium]